MKALGSLVRAVLEKYSRGRVVRRRLPTDLGGYRLLVSPDSSLRFWRPGLAHIDATLLALARELVKPGDTVWDIGANVGLFSFAAAYLAGPSGCVVAVEPDPWLSSLIVRSAAEAPVHRYAAVKVLTAAIGDRQAVAEFAIASRGRAASHLASIGGSTQAGGARGTLLVATVTLDEMMSLGPAPDLVKIDVEGAEALCLRGGRQVLRALRPRVVCEVASASADAVSDELRALGYRLFDGSLPCGNRTELARAPWTCLAIPVEGG